VACQWRGRVTKHLSRRSHGHGKRGFVPHGRTDLTMKRGLLIVAPALALAACSSMPSWMQFELPKLPLAATMVQFESEPAGAEARTSLGQSCRTPCSMEVAAGEFTVDFTLPGYQPQTVPVRLVASNEPVDPMSGQAPSARLVPNPVFAALQAMPPPPPPAPKKPAAAKKKPKPAPRPAPTAMAPAPAPAPASPWPSPPPAR
jgi:hypothetical protein